MMKTILYVLILILSFSITVAVRAEIAIIVHPDVDITLSKQQAKKIFMGKMKSLPGNSDLVVVVAQNKREDVTQSFNKKVLRQRESQLKAYWSKVVFTGKGHPPEEFPNDAEVIKFVLENPQSIGYINKSSVTDAVKVVLTVD